MDAVALIEMKMALEFGVAPVSCILPIATHEQDDQPLVLVSRTADECRLYLREDVPEHISRQLHSLGATTCFTDEASVRAILARSMPCRRVRRIRWYTTSRRPTDSEFADVLHIGGRYVIHRDGREVAWAETDWENDDAAEVSIETLEPYRRRGFARQVTAAWIAAIMDVGKVGFYSHRLANDASRAVAESLGLAHLSDEVEYI